MRKRNTADMSPLMRVYRNFNPLVVKPTGGIVDNDLVTK